MKRSNMNLNVFLSLVLFITQVTLYPAAWAADPTSEQVDQQTTSVQEKLKASDEAAGFGREGDVQDGNTGEASTEEIARQNEAANKAHESATQGGNASACDERKHFDSDRMKESMDYLGDVKTKDLKKIQDQLNTMDTALGAMSDSDKSVALNPATYIDEQDNLTLQGQKKEIVDALAQARKDQTRLDKELREKREAYNRIKKCNNTDFCTSEERNALSAARLSLQEAEAAVRANNRKIADLKREVKRADQRIATQVPESQLTNAETDMASNDANNAATQVLAEKLGSEYEQLRKDVNAGTDSAAAFAEAKIAYAEQLELEKANNGDFKLYQVAVADFNENTGNGKMALSNLEIMANATAGIKHLKCRDVDDTDMDYRKKSGSKAYHLFRAASATWIAAQINQTKDYSENSLCKFKEDFNINEEYDEQTKILERAANLYDEVVDASSLKIANRNDALTMYEDALAAAQSELQVKLQRVSKADKQVKRGKKWIKRTEMQITIARTLIAIHYMIAMINSAACGPYNPGACIKAAMEFSWVRTFIAVYLYGYLYPDLRKANAFTDKWEKKLVAAKKHSHLACNYDEALAMEKGEIARGERERERVRQEIQNEMQNIECTMSNKNCAGNDAAAPTSFINFDKDIQLGFVANLKTATNDRQALLLLSDYVRHLKGERSSLPYDALAIDTSRLEKDLDQLGMNLARKTKGVGKLLMQLIIPSAVAFEQPSNESSESLGVATGSTSFAYFLTMKVEAWKDQSFDAAKFGSKAVNLNALDVRPSVGALPSDEQVGFPLPETRVLYLESVVMMVKQNLRFLGCDPDIPGNPTLAANGTCCKPHPGVTTDTGDEDFDEQPACYKAQAYKEQYVQLLKKAKSRLNLDEQGLVQDVPPPAQTAAKTVAPCIDVAGNGTVQCFKLEVPTFGAVQGGAQTSSLVFNAAQAELSGDTEGAGVAKGELRNKAGLIRDRIVKNRKDLRDSLIKSGVKNPKSSKDRAADSLASRRARGFANFDANNSGQSSSDRRSGRRTAFAGRGSQVASDSASAAGLAAGGTGGINKKGSKFKYKGYKFKASKVAFGSSKRKRSKAASTLAQSDNAASGQSQDELAKVDYIDDKENSHHRRKLNKESQSSTGIVQDSRLSLFKVISKRYIKSAFPRLLKRKKL